MTTKLPQINSKRRVQSPDANLSNNFYNVSDRLNRTAEAGNFTSPFKLPSDDEVFVYRELERQKREELKHITQDLKVWDKRTVNSRKPLRTFKNFSSPVKDHNTSKMSLTYQEYNSQDKALITEAQRIMKERRKEKSSVLRENKEGITELLEQKREMFLVEMTVGIIEKERETLVSKINEKDFALKKSDDMLERDWKEFENYKLTNKLETDQAIQKYNQEVEARKRTDTDYKIKNNELTSMKADKLKNEELTQKYTEAKNFLIKLTPKEILDHSQGLLDTKIEQVKAKWIERELINREEAQSSVLDGGFKGAHANARDKDKDKASAKRLVTKADLEKVFQDKLERGEIDEVEEYLLNEKMYFTDPEQLVEIYTRLEESNLSVIQMMQDTEQNLENMKNSLKQRRSDFDHKLSGLREHKQQLEKRRLEKENIVKQLIQQTKEPRLLKKDDGMIPIRKKIIEICNVMKGESKIGIDTENVSTLDLLESVELHLEKQLSRLFEIKPTRVLELKKECEDERKRENRKLQQEKEQQLADERREKAMDRTREKTTKRQGRKDMVKSIPLEKKKAVEQVDTNTEEEEGMKYYKPYLTKF